LGARILDEPGIQSEPKALEIQLSKIWESEPSEEVLSDMDLVQVAPSDSPLPVVEPEKSSRANSEPIILPPLSTEKNSVLEESGNIQSFVQTFVSSFLEQSLAEYLNSCSNPSSSPNSHDLLAASESPSNQQFIPLYIQDLLHTVLQNYLTTNVLKAESLSTESQQSLSPIPPSRCTSPTGTGEVETAVSVEKLDERLSQKLVEISKEYEEKILNYEERLQELQQNYDKLQKSSQETISSQSLKLLTMSELLEEKGDEMLVLRSENERQTRKEDEMRQQLVECLGLLSEELSVVRNTWKGREQVLGKEKESLVEQLNDAQNELAEANYYYQVCTFLPSSLQCLFL
jgi:hypothetical protein